MFFPNRNFKALFTNMHIFIKFIVKKNIVVILLVNNDVLIFCTFHFSLGEKMNMINVRILKNYFL